MPWPDTRRKTISRVRKRMCYCLWLFIFFCSFPRSLLRERIIGSCQSPSLLPTLRESEIRLNPQLSFRQPEFLWRGTEGFFSWSWPSFEPALIILSTTTSLFSPPIFCLLRALRISFNCILIVFPPTHSKLIINQFLRCIFTTMSRIQQWGMARSKDRYKAVGSTS